MARVVWETLSRPRAMCGDEQWEVGRGEVAGSTFRHGRCSPGKKEEEARPANKMNDVAGDGTTTVTVLTYHILNEANKLIAAGHNPMSEEGDLDFARSLGDRLRAVRVQRGWSLHDVQVAAHGEFSAASVGSYERGDRLISVPRLNRLARLYRVPLQELLPLEGAERRRNATTTALAGAGPLVIDLAALDELESADWEPVRDFSRAVQGRRGDFNGRVLTIRAEDARGLALVCGHPVDEIERVVGVRAASGM